MFLCEDKMSLPYYLIVLHILVLSSSHVPLLNPPFLPFSAELCGQVRRGLSILKLVSFPNSAGAYDLSWFQGADMLGGSLLPISCSHCWLVLC